MLSQATARLIAAARLLQSFYEELAAMYRDKRLELARNSFRTPDAMNRLFPYEAGADVKLILLNIDDPFWVENGPAEEILRFALVEPTIQKNAFRFLELLLVAAYQGCREYDVATIKRFLQRTTIVSQLWDAAIATPLQFRMLVNARELREKLETEGVSGLANPTWLMQSTVAQTTLSEDDVTIAAE